MKKILSLLFLITSSMLASDSSYNSLWTSVNNNCVEKYCNGTLSGCSQANQEKANQCTRKNVLTALQNKCQTKTPSCSAQELRMLSMYECQSALCPQMDLACFKKNSQGTQSCSLLSYPEDKQLFFKVSDYCMNACQQTAYKANYDFKQKTACTQSCFFNYFMESCLEQKCSAGELNAYSNWFSKQYIPWLQSVTPVSTK